MRPFPKPHRRTPHTLTTFFLLLPLLLLFTPLTYGIPMDELAVIPAPHFASLFDQPRDEQCDPRYGRPTRSNCGVIIESLGGQRLSLDNYRAYRFFHSFRDLIAGQINIALPYTRTFRDCAIFIDTPEHIISAEPAENQWDTFSWNNIKAKANNIKESCITERGYGGSIPAGVAGRLRIHLLGPDSTFLEDYARIHPNSMRRRPSGSASSSSTSTQQPNTEGFMMPSTEAANAATICHSSADCEAGSSCPVDENGGEGGQEVSEETVYGRALGLAAAVCMTMMKGNGLGP